MLRSLKKPTSGTGKCTPVTTNYKRAGELEKQEVQATYVKVFRVRRKNTRTKPAQKAQGDTRMTRIVWRRMENKTGIRSGQMVDRKTDERQKVVLFTSVGESVFSKKEYVTSWKIRNKPEEAGTDWNI